MPLLSIDGQKYTVPTGSCLYSWTQEAGWIFPCGGHGICGKCRVLVSGAVSSLTDTERRLLSEEDIRNGIRLACMTYVNGDCEISTLSSR